MITEKELLNRLWEIYKYKCNGCLADMGSCSCEEDKDKMILQLIKLIIEEGI
jgi:hypothetical protein